VSRVLIWDLPTRVFHGLLIVGFVTAWTTGGSDQWLSLHSFAGCVMLGLIGFRLVWGWCGSRYARFGSFAYGPAAVAAHLRQLLAGVPSRYLGHNPAGSAAIYGMLALGLAVGLTGILAQGGEERHLLAAGALSIAEGTLVRQAHAALSWLMLVLVGCHLAGIAVEAWLTKENLPRSMLTGYKEAPPGSAAGARHGAVAGALVVAVAAFGICWFAYAWRGPVEARIGPVDALRTVPPVAFVGLQLPDDPVWREECSACHLAYHPSLLPARSWQRLLKEQDRHFGTDLLLDPARAAAILAFLQRNAAEHSPTEAAFKINRSVSSGITPLRITETPYWISKHGRLGAQVWSRPAVRSKTNCAACHVDALGGSFEDSAMRVPR